MKLTNQLIEDIVKQVIGEDAVKIVHFLKNKKNISEFKIADKTKTEIHEIRNILYRLHSHHLVTYIKKKDRQKGWYISYWTFNPKRIKDIIKNLKVQRLERLRERLKKEEANKGNFYMCKNACVRLDFHSATEFDFKCPECGELLNLVDNEKTIDRLKKQIKEVEKEMRLNK
jgi:transcription initiation factor TFIIE subunit alpha